MRIARWLQGSRAWRTAAVSGALSLAATAAAQKPAPAVQWARDTVRGRALRPDSTTAPAAEVLVTDVESRLTRAATADSSGRFTVLVDSGSGTYVVVARAPLLRAARTRVTRGPDGIAVITLVLAKPPVLPAVQVRAKTRELPSAGKPIGALAGTGEVGRNDGPASLRESLLEAAIAIPGVEVLGPSIKDGVAVLGQGPAQSRVTLNGMSVGALQLPRDAGRILDVATGSSDPARGGFSGAELAVRTQQSAGVTRRFLRGSVESGVPDATSGSRHLLDRNLQVSGVMDGSLGKRWRHSTAAQATFIPSAARSIFTPVGASSESLSAATTNALSDAAERAGAPLGTTGPNARLGGAVSTQVNRLQATHPLDLTIAASFDRRPDAGAGFTVAPSATSARSEAALAAQVGSSWKPRPSLLHEVRVGAHASRETVTPRWQAPTALVNTQGATVTGEGPALTVVAGGGLALPESRISGAEVLDRWSWISSDGAHRVSATGDLELLHAGWGQSPNLGAYQFLSLEDFGANRPVAYSRLSSGSRATRQMATSAAASDQWRLGERVQVQFGGRIDGFRVQTANAGGLPPGAAHGGPLAGLEFSPRLGLVARLGHGPSAVPLRVVAGRYVSRWSAQALGAFARPDRPSEYVQCTGDFAPLDWTAPTLADNPCSTSSNPRAPQPEVTWFSPGLRPNDSWRASIGATRQLGRFEFGLVATMSRDGGGLVAQDLNLRSAPAWRLEAEATRPIFSPVDAITPSGRFALAQSREVLGLGRQVLLSSEGRGRARELQLRIAPAKSGGLNYWVATYVLGAAQQLRPGLYSATAGDPRVTGWGPSDFDIRHRVVVQAGHQLGPDFVLSGILNLRSGLPYTPLVDVDINGDGVANDAAFVFAPGAANVRGSVADIGGPGRSCLTRFAGQVAGINGCRGPWSALANAQLATTMGSRWLPRYTTVAAQFVNLPALLDAALHGGSRRGWGRVGTPDTRLLSVTSFDAASRTFGYRVNPAFGSLSPASGGWAPPFRITLEIRSEVGPDPVGQEIGRLLSRGRSTPGARRTAEQLRAELRDGVYDPLDDLFRLRDSIMLSSTQEAALRGIQQSADRQLDALFRPVSEYLANLPAAYDPGESVRRTRTAKASAYGVMMSVARDVRTVLGSDQLSLIGGATRMFLDPSSLALLQRAYR